METPHPTPKGDGKPCSTGWVDTASRRYEYSDVCFLFLFFECCMSGRAYYIYHGLFTYEVYEKSELSGDIAQMARAAALQAVGRGFEPPYLH